MSEIIDVLAREILDSRGNPTVKVELCTGVALFCAAFQGDTPTREFQCFEALRRDEGPVLSKGVLKAVANINDAIGSSAAWMGPIRTASTEDRLGGVQHQEHWGWCEAKPDTNEILLAVPMAVHRAGNHRSM